MKKIIYTVYKTWEQLCYPL